MLVPFLRNRVGVLGQGLSQKIAESSEASNLVAIELLPDLFDRQRARIAQLVHRAPAPPGQLIVALPTVTLAEFDFDEPLVDELPQGLAHSRGRAVALTREHAG